MFRIDTAGTWTYVANSANDSLNTGDTVSDSFTVTSADGTTTTVKINITGSNDAAVLSSATENLTETDSVLSTTGTLSLSDVDSAQPFVPQSNVAATSGVFSLATTGARTYVSPTAHHHLNTNEPAHATYHTPPAHTN